MAKSKTCTIITLIFLISFTTAHEICKDFASYQSITNSYCSAYSGRTCCSADQDSHNQAEVSGLHISDATCASFMKNISCSKCDPWGAHLFGAETANASVPVEPAVFAVPALCRLYCEQFYAACADVSMSFASGQSPWSGAKIRDSYQSADAFCNSFSNPPTDVTCFSGEVYVPPAEVPPPTDSEKICVETFKAGIDSAWFIAMEDPHDGTDRLFFAHKNGTILLMKKSNADYLGTMIAFENIVNDAEAGLVGFTLHPQFKSNGRFYIYRSCPADVCKVTCNVDADCGAAVSCTNGYCAGDHVDVLEELISVPTETVPSILSRRTILMQAKPTRIHNSGCLVFGPHDGMLYFSMGDGGPFFDPHQTAQDLSKWLGKLLRIDVEGSTAEKPYRVPSDNPFVNTAGARPEIFAYGLRNPWRFTFDSLRPSYLLLGDVGASLYEEVNLVVAGGNYGWSGFEGFDNSTFYAGPPVVNPIFPILGYTHAEVGGGPAVIAGKVYRGAQDPCKYGAYFYADWQATRQWIARESRQGSGTFYSRSLQLTCAGDSLPGCRAFDHTVYDDSQPTFAVDSEGRLYWIGSKLILRMADPQRCGLSTDCTVPPTTTSTSPTTTSQATTTQAPSTTAALTTKPPIVAPTNAGTTTNPSTTEATTTQVPSTTTMPPETPTPSSGASEQKMISLVALVALLFVLV